MIAQALLVRVLGWVSGGLLLACVLLSLALWSASIEVDAITVDRDKHVTNATTAAGNLIGCKAANTAWGDTVDDIQTALHTCTRERSAIEQRGRLAVEAVEAELATLEKQRDAWEANTAAAEQIPSCRAVLDLQLCPELGEY